MHTVICFNYCNTSAVTKTHHLTRFNDSSSKSRQNIEVLNKCQFSSIFIILLGNPLCTRIFLKYFMFLQHILIFMFRFGDKFIHWFMWRRFVFWKPWPLFIFPILNFALLIRHQYWSNGHVLNNSESTLYIGH